MNRFAVVVSLAVIFLMSQQIGMAQETSYLILDDIGSYKLEKESREFPDRKLRSIIPYKRYNGSAGVLNATGHFVYDHDDISYETGYANSIVPLGVEVQVTQHAGSESDKWLLHELEKGYRDSKPDRLGLLLKGVYKEKISGNTVLRLEISGGSYRWISNNVVVYIRYEDPDFTKPEPLEVVNAYLAKFPSTIPSTFALDSAHNVQWIKDEMERRLWLGDKWYAQIQSSDPKLRDKLKSMTDSMVVFLNYREKYFGIASKDEKIALETALSQNNVTAVQAKLTEYKNWWTAHKTDAISLP